MNKEHYIKSPDNKWFDGYSNHDVLILDELRKQTFTCAYLLRLLDRYKMGVEVKGGTRQMVAKVIIVTSSKSPEALWADMAGLADPEDVGQLQRRITEVVQLPKPEDYKHRFLARMRKALEDMGKPEVTEADDKYGEWDNRSGEPVPAYIPAMFQPQPQETPNTGGASASSAPKRARSEILPFS